LFLIALLWAKPNEELFFNIEIPLMSLSFFAASIASITSITLAFFLLSNKASNGLGSNVPL